MTHFSSSERVLIADIATAVKWHAESLIEAGTPFEQAKLAAITRARPAWKHLTPGMRQAVEALCGSISVADLSQRTRRAAKDQMQAAIEKAKGKPLGWLDSVLFRFTGMVWSV